MVPPTITVLERVALEEVGPPVCGPNSATYSEQYLVLASFAVKWVHWGKYNCSALPKTLGKN